MSSPPPATIRVVAVAAEREVVAASRSMIRSSPPIVGAIVRHEAGDQRQRGERAARSFARSPAATRPLSPSTTSSPVARVDRVAARAADDDVVAAERRDRVVAAEGRVDADRQRDAARDAVGAVAGAAVAEHARRGGLPRGQARHVGHRVAERGQRPRRVEVQHAAAVAEDDVAARAAVDHVVALAAEDDQRQRRRSRACTVSSSAPSALRQREVLALDRRTTVTITSAPSVAPASVSA